MARYEIIPGDNAEARKFVNGEIVDYISLVHDPFHNNLELPSVEIDETASNNAMQEEFFHRCFDQGLSVIDLLQHFDQETAKSYNEWINSNISPHDKSLELGK